MKQSSFYYYLQVYFGCCIFLCFSVSESYGREIVNGISPLPALSFTASVSQKQLPVLINRSGNSLITITCRTDQTVAIRAFDFTFKGTTEREDIEAIYIAVQNPDNKKWKSIATLKNPGKRVSVPVEYALTDSAVFQISCDIRPTALLEHFVDVQCVQIHTDNGKMKPSDFTGVVQRLGIAVRDKGWDGVNTYRIPGIATTNAGTLLAVYDVRYESARDLQGHIDIGVSRSTNRGQSWEPMRVALDMKDWGGLPEKFNGVSDAAILVDRNTGDIFVAGLWMYGVLDKEGRWIEGLTQESKNWQHQWGGKGSQPGLGVKETSQFLIAGSSDDGKSWGEPVNITAMAKNPEWWLYAPAPGCGITLRDGTLVFPTQGRDSSGLPFSNITYSRDGGKNWKSSQASYSNTTECAVVELSDGMLMLNMRNNRNSKEKGDKNGRAIYTTADLGEHWEKHSSSENALIEPVCMGSLHKHEYRDGKSVLLFSNPDSKYERRNMTLKISFDEGKSWSRSILLDAGGSYGYSCITSLDENTIGILYESSRAQMLFQQISLKEILGR